MHLAEGDHLLSLVVERQQAHDNDDHIEDEGHIHVGVNHQTDHFAKIKVEVPFMNGIVVYPERHGEKEDKVCKDEIVHSDGGCGHLAGLHDVNHQAEADGAA